MRYTAYGIILVLTVLLGGLTFWQPAFAIPFALVAALAALGTRDLLQRRHNLLRNYPLLAHFRWLFEAIRPEIRQYLLESDTEATPFSRYQRAVVYQRAKQVNDKHPFGTELDVYAEGYEWLNPSVAAKPKSERLFRVSVGGPQCSKPYSASVLNISAMSFGSLSANAIRALNAGAARGGFAHDTGEGGISRYHREHGADLIWEIGSGYFGCRDRQGNFDAERFRDQAMDPQVKMVEIKLSQGAKPGHGGVLPGCKVTPEIAEARGVPAWQDVISPSAHSAFDSPTGAEGGTGAAPLELTNHVGMPLRDGLLFAHNTLTGAGVRDRVRLAASGKVFSGFKMAANMALGADWCNAARPFMFALGCVQSKSCHTDHCPTGIATQNPKRARAIVVSDKADRVHHFHRETVLALGEVVSTLGLDEPAELRPHHLCRRTADSEVRTAEELYPCLRPGELANGTSETPGYRDCWAMARADTFQPARA